MCLKTKHPRHKGKEKVITAHRTRSPTTPKHTGWSEHGRRGITLCTVAVHKRITDHAERFRDDLSMWCNFRVNYFPQGRSKSYKPSPQCLSNAITPISTAWMTVHLMRARATQVPWHFQQFPTITKIFPQLSLSRAHKCWETKRAPFSRSSARRNL